MYQSIRSSVSSQNGSSRSRSRNPRASTGVAPAPGQPFNFAGTAETNNGQGVPVAISPSVHAALVPVGLGPGSVPHIGCCYGYGTDATYTPPMQWRQPNDWIRDTPRVNNWSSGKFDCTCGQWCHLIYCGYNGGCLSGTLVGVLHRSLGYFQEPSPTTREKMAAYTAIWQYANGYKIYWAFRIREMAKRAYGIQDPSGDWLERMYVICCPDCSVLQVARHISHRGFPTYQEFDAVRYEPQGCLAKCCDHTGWNMSMKAPVVIQMAPVQQQVVIVQQAPPAAVMQ